MFFSNSSFKMPAEILTTPLRAKRFEPDGGRFFSYDAKASEVLDRM
jgi:hypothetical protein